ncbi:MAG: hypothetical protein JSU70_18555 [Phycisphaerales bacterium]|nr:MAG: hypothetical protein JSU70_18555 [Phycisphaerales bacterium]
MGRELIYAVLGLALSITARQAGLGASKTDRGLLREGFLFKGVDGKMSRGDSSDEWFFEPGSDISVDGDPVKAGTRLRLLPSAALETMVPDANNQPAADLKLWAKVTRYKGENFVLPVYFLPLSKVEESAPSRPDGGVEHSTSQESQQRPDPTALKPGAELGIPQEVMDKLKKRKTIRRQPAAQSATKPDTIIVDRVGFIRHMGPQAFFALDAIGRNVQHTSFGLLPCRTLELAQRQLVAQPDPIRFRVAGIVTEYKGKKLLLLQKATRVYSHGNFD